MTDPDDITALLVAWRQGDQASLGKLISLVYQELRSLAGRYMRREADDHTLQTTALVHEAYLRLAGEQGRNWQDRAHFFGVAANIMRNLLVDHARAGRRAKRGGGSLHLMLDEARVLTAPNPDVLLALDEALTRLAELDARASRVVELRYFAGLSLKEAAIVLGISEKTVKRDWSLAKTWLRAELRAKRPSPSRSCLTPREGTRRL
jgi:RNA polymerase sigma factor (TIGR02999 family)